MKYLATAFQGEDDILSQELITEIVTIIANIIATDDSLRDDKIKIIRNVLEMTDKNQLEMIASFVEHLKI